MDSPFDKKYTYSLRGLCVIGIIIHHLYPIGSNRIPEFCSIPLDFIISKLGYWATSVFFFLSGFGLYLSINKNKPINSHYILRHLKNLYLPFIFLWFIDCLYCCMTHTFNFEQAIKYAFTLGTSVEQLWFLKTIFVVYILEFCIAKLTKSNRIQVGLSFIFIIIYILTQIHYLKWGEWWYNSLLCFPIGMLIAEKYEIIHKAYNGKTQIILSIIFIICALSLAICENLPSNESLICFDINMTIIVGVLFALSSILCFPRLNIQNKALNFIGKYSLQFYIFHMFIKSTIHNRVILNNYLNNIIVILTLTLLLVFIYERLNYYLSRDRT